MISERIKRIFTNFVLDSLCCLDKSQLFCIQTARLKKIFKGAYYFANNFIN